MDAPTSESWQRAYELVEEAITRGSSPPHGLEILAERVRTARGLPAAPGLANIEQVIGIRSLIATDLLTRVRGVCEGPIVIIKGLEVALHYPDPTLRPFGDLDLLVADSAAAQRALISAGFKEVMDPDLFVDIHQERPLELPGFPVLIEIHKAPKWPDFLEPPDFSELLAVAVESRSGVAGIQALPDAHHAVVVAAHAWTHGPLNHINQLLDVAVLAERVDRGEMRRIARRWGIEGIWQTTISCADNLFGHDPPPLAQRTWARHLQALRERTVAETHLERYLSPFWAYPWPMAMQVAASMLRAELRPAQGETWREKTGRAGVALRNAFRPRSLHDRELGPEAEKRRQKGRFTRIS